MYIMIYNYLLNKITPEGKNLLPARVKILSLKRHLFWKGRQILSDQSYLPWMFYPFTINSACKKINPWRANHNCSWWYSDFFFFLLIFFFPEQSRLDISDKASDSHELSSLIRLLSATIFVWLFKDEPLPLSRPFQQMTNWYFFIIFLRK